jgi:hypothetical protein
MYQCWKNFHWIFVLSLLELYVHHFQYWISFSLQGRIEKEEEMHFQLGAFNLASLCFYLTWISVVPEDSVNLGDVKLSEFQTLDHCTENKRENCLGIIWLLSQVQYIGAMELCQFIYFWNIVLSNNMLITAFSLILSSWSLLILQYVWLTLYFMYWSSELWHFVVW